MDVDYHLTPEDLFAFQWRAAYLSPKSRRERRMSYLYLFLPFLVMALLPMIGSGRSAASAVVSLLILIVVFPLAAVAYGFLQKRMLRRAILALVAREHPEKGQLGRHRIAIDDQGLVETTAVSESRTSWAGVDRIEQDADYIFIYTAPILAHVIPKRAFTESTADEFYQFVASRLPVKQ